MSSEGVLLSAEMLHAVLVLVLVLQVMTDPDVPGPSDPYLREHLHWYA
jgi:hypothetical protein